MSNLGSDRWPGIKIRPFGGSTIGSFAAGGSVNIKHVRRKAIVS